MTQLTLREARPSDRDELIGMRLCLQEHAETSNSRIWHLTEEGRQRLSPNVDEMLSDEDSRVIVVEANGEIIGFAWGRVTRRTDYEPERVGFINIVYVKKAHRRRGVGANLVQDLCRFFRANDMEEVNLNYILGNREAEAFWNGLGFVPVRASANTTLENLEVRLRERSVHIEPMKPIKRERGQEQGRG